MGQAERTTDYLEMLGPSSARRRPRSKTVDPWPFQMGACGRSHSMMPSLSI